MEQVEKTKQEIKQETQEIKQGQKEIKDDQSEIKQGQADILENTARILVNTEQIKQQVTAEKQAILDAIKVNSGGKGGMSDAQIQQILDGLDDLKGGQEELKAGQKLVQAGVASMNVGLEVVRKTMVNNLRSADVPLAFVILPESSRFDMSLPEATDENTQIEEIANTVEEAKEKWSSRFSAFTSMFSSSSPAEVVEKAWDDHGESLTKSLTTNQMTLFLIDMYTWEPIGDGYQVPAAGKIAVKFLPLMAGTVKAMKTVNGVGKLARLFGLPFPEIPPEYIDKANNAVDALDVGSKFECVAGATETEGNQEMTPFQVVRCRCLTITLHD